MGPDATEEDVLALCGGHTPQHYKSVLPRLLRYESNTASSRGSSLPASCWRGLYVLSAPAENGDIGKVKGQKLFADKFTVLSPLGQACFDQTCSPRLLGCRLPLLRASEAAKLAAERVLRG